MRFLLDTSAAIFLRDHDHADQSLLALASVPALSFISVVELEGGVDREPQFRGIRRRLLDRMLVQFPLLPFDAACAQSYRAIVEAVGFSRPKVVDRMIAATALAHGLTLVTSNGRDFHDVPGLELLNWPSTPHPPSATPQ